MNEHGVPIFEWDVKHSTAHDLRKPKVRSRVLGWITGGLVCAVWLGTPCTSWCRPQQFWRGAFPLRNAQYPLGAPWNKPQDVVKVRLGNITAAFSSSVIRRCAALGIVCVMENPASSMIWDAPFFKSIFRSKIAEQICTDFCQWGVPWRKRTKFCFCHVDLSSVAARCSSKRGICDRTGRKHEVLQGKVASGVNKTLIAEPYPVRLCTSLAKCFSNALCQQRLMRCWQFVKSN